jgi:SAM-dependent methyltransferase
MIDMDERTEQSTDDGLHEQRAIAASRQTTPPYLQLVKEAVANESDFVRVVLSGRRRGATSPWVKVVVRPVLIRKQYHVQFSYFDAKKDVSKNYQGEDIETEIERVVALPFKNILVQMTDRDIHILVGNKGNASITTKKHAPATIELNHNRAKQRLLTLENSADVLGKLGLATKNGAIQADKQRKYVQINEYLKIVSETGYFSRIAPAREVVIVDFGCGNAYLTFATYHFVANMLGLQTRLIGVDTNKDLIERNTVRARELGWSGLSFETSNIAEYQPAVQPDVVIALHACDTATDDAIARGIQWNSDVIITAPCCQHHLQAQLERQTPPAPFRSMIRQPALRERFGDMLTDTLRALVLRRMGYATDIIEFIATEHTPKNLMIRSVKGSSRDSQAADEYAALKSLWNVTPYLESLLGDELR